MILTCPDCSTRYLTKREAIGPNGRTVRCASCSATWFVAAEPDVMDLEDAVEGAALGAGSLSSAVSNDAPDFENPILGKDAVVTGLGAANAADEFRDAREREKVRKRLFGVSLIWLITLAILMTLAALLFVFREKIVQKFPATSTVYQAFGIEATLSGLTISDVLPRSITHDGETMMVINGTIKNPNSSERDVPLIIWSMHAKDGENLAEWVVDLDLPPMPGGHEEAFVTRYPNPPIDAVSLRHRFADPDADRVPSDIAPAGAPGDAGAGSDSDTDGQLSTLIPLGGAQNSDDDNGENAEDPTP